METIGIRELRQHASRYVKRAASGETIIVTDHGRPVARLIPPPDEGGRRALIESGRLRPAEGSIDDLGPPLKPLRGAPLPSEVLSEMRRDER
jgi:prevent-host-death family protein